MAASPEQELGSVLNLKFDANGLITAVTVDADSHEVLMVAFMNQAALDKTMATRKATYTACPCFHRSRSPPVSL